MADIEEALVKLLRDDDLLNNVVIQRIYATTLPRGVTLPALSYRNVSGPRDHTQQGPSGLVTARYQISAWGANYDVARDVAGLVRLALIGYQGSPLGDVLISSIRLLNQIDLDEPEAGVFQRTLDFAVQHNESIPA